MRALLLTAAGTDNDEKDDESGIDDDDEMGCGGFARARLGTGAEDWWSSGVHAADAPAE